MKRLPVLLSFVLFLGLCATIAYWVMETTKPPLRPIASAPRAAQSDVTVASASQLFGGSRAVAVAANYQLRGVVVAGNPTESVAILSADGKPPQAVRVGREIMPGTVVQEVAPRHVLLSEGGVVKRVDLPENVAPAAPAAANPLAGRNFPPVVQPQFGQVPPLPQIPPRAGQAVPQVPGQPPEEAPVPPRASEQFPGQRPGAVIPETGLPPGFPPPDVDSAGEGIDPGVPPEQQAIPPDMQQ